jgi:PTH1 family peptidyl-tRNA hydrolase
LEIIKTVNNQLFQIKSQEAQHEEKVFLLKPMTFMNLSGNSVREFLRYHQIPVKDISGEKFINMIVFHDELDKNLSEYKMMIKNDYFILFLFF